MSDISKISFGQAEYNLKDTSARGELENQKVLASTVKELGKTVTYSASTEEYFSRRKEYYLRSGSEGEYTYVKLVLGTNYEAREYTGINGIYERTGTGTRTYQADLTAVFQPDTRYVTYRNDIKKWQSLVAVESDPGLYEYIPGVTAFGDKVYEVFLDDTYVYSLSTDEAVVSGKTYCQRTGGAGTEADPYKYKVWNLSVGRPFTVYCKNGYSMNEITGIVNPLIAPHQQTAQST